MAGSKEEAIRLRLEQRLSLKDVAAQLGVSKSTASIWLREHPLTEVERLDRQSTNGLKMGGWNRKERGERSKFHQSVDVGSLSNAQKGRIAEAAVTFRLALHGFDTFVPTSGNDKFDRVVSNPKSGRMSKIQVRWVRDSRRDNGDSGVPMILLRCFDGRYATRTYTSADCDVLVGYDLFTDTAYVYPFESISHLSSTVSVSSAHAERWDLVP